MKLTFPAVALLALSTAACAVAPADQARRIDLNWRITPDNAQRTRMTVESGEVIVSWSAEARQTHVMTGIANAPALVAARTTYGSVYCAEQVCYEDRDADGYFDHEWNVMKSGAAPKYVLAITEPDELKSPIPFRESATSVVVFKQMLGLVYNGPMEGVPKDNGKLSPMIGELALGWHGGPDVPRTPDGSGWARQQSLPFIIGEDLTPVTSVMPLGLSYTAFGATIDGQLDLEFEATPQDSVDLSAKPKFKIDGEDGGDAPELKIQSPET